MRKTVLTICLIMMCSMGFSDEKLPSLSMLKLPAKPVIAIDQPTSDTQIPISRIELLLHEPPLQPMTTSTFQTSSTLTVDASTSLTTETMTVISAIRDDKILLNQATVEELVKFLKLDYNRAKNIVQYRRIIGDFDSIHELKKVFGMNEVLLDRHRKKLLYREPDLK